MPWLRHFALSLLFVATLFGPANTATCALASIAAGGMTAPSLATGDLVLSQGERVLSQMGDDVASGLSRAVAARGGFRSFSAFKRAMGPAGPGQAWHHIVEQTPGNIARFGPEAIHNTANIVRLPHGAGSIHARLSGFYSSVRPEITGSTSLTVCQWLGTQSFEAQSAFGQRAIQNVTSGVWP